MLFKKLQPSGSQLPRLYGLAKVHENNVPLQPVLSMPGSPYQKIALQISDWLSVVKESNINSSTKKISDNIQNLVLAEEDVLISFHVTSLYTNVPVIEAIEDCTKLLFSGRYKLPPVDRETLIQDSGYFWFMWKFSTIQTYIPCNNREVTSKNIIMQSSRERSQRAILKTNFESYFEKKQKKQRHKTSSADLSSDLLSGIKV